MLTLDFYSSGFVEILRNASNSINYVPASDSEERTLTMKTYYKDINTWLKRNDFFIDDARKIKFDQWIARMFDIHFFNCDGRVWWDQYNCGKVGDIIARRDCRVKIVNHGLFTAEIEKV